MTGTQSIVAIVDGSEYMDRIAGVLIRSGLALVTHESAADGLLLDGEHATPHAIVYCVRDGHASVERVRRTCEQFARLQSPTRVVVCSGDFQFVQSLRSENHDDGVVVLFEPFDVETLLEAIGTPSQSEARTPYECI